MATPSTRNLVLLLSGGHTVRIALRDGDLTAPGTTSMFEFLESMPSVVTLPGDILRDGAVENSCVDFAYIEDPSLPTYGIDHQPEPNDLQRITVEGPGTVVQYG